MINKKITQIIIILVLLCIIIPFVTLSFYNHPSRDDFYYAVFARENGIINGVIKHHKEWTGRYTATFLLCLNTILTGTNKRYLTVYKIIPIVLILLLAGALYYCTGKIIKCLHNNRNLSFKSPVILSTSSIIFSLFLSRLMLPVDFFYWLPGSLTYCVSLIVFLIFIALLTKLGESSNGARGYYTIKLFSLILLIIVMCGTNEIVIVAIGLTLATGLAISILNRRHIPAFIIMSVIFILAALILIKAPGNTVRSSGYRYEFRPFVALLVSTLTAVYYTTYWLTDVPVIAFSILSLPALIRIVKDVRILKRFTERGLTVLLILFLATPVLFYLPSALGMGISPPYRTLNLIYIFTLMIWMICLCITAELIRRRNVPARAILTSSRFFMTVMVILTITCMTVAATFFARSFFENLTNTFPCNLIKSPGLTALLKNLMVASLGLFIVSLIYQKSRIKDSLITGIILGTALLSILFSGTVITAFKDVFIKAPVLNKELTSRYRIIENSREDNRHNVSVPPITTYPTTIYIFDITPLADDWNNRHCARFFNIKFITVKKQ